ncbi:MAG: molybdopterin-synthase adenylyltransferase MoeB [Candidatus Heimdallarchaeota archaeon]|nr:molybdopterin-synthase adenylyltransferase MoeB [Candidatus Heimdallarchaeota archaeon]
MTSVLNELVQTPHKSGLSHEEITRYSRHLIMPEVGVEGQKKLRDAKVLMIGAGGLGSPIGMYLAAAGVGTIGIVDFDIVDYSNLQRQIIHSTEEVGKPKLDSAERTLKGINPLVNVIKYNFALSSENALDLFKDYDIIVDGTDNFPTRYLVNDACVLLGKPSVYGSIFRFEGQASVFNVGDGPCYRCLYSEPPPPGLVPSCAEGGVFGVIPGLVGTIQATEIIKLVLGEGESLSGRLLLIDALDMEFKQLKLRKDPNCVVCGPNPTVTELIDYEEFCGVPAIEADGVELKQENIMTIKEFVNLRDSDQTYKLVDVREPHELEISKIEGSILIPKDLVETMIDDLDRDELIVLHCKTGVRSGNVLLKMKKLGFTNVKNLMGGINAYAQLVDPSLPLY